MLIFDEHCHSNTGPGGIFALCRHSFPDSALTPFLSTHHLIKQVCGVDTYKTIIKMIPWYCSAIFASCGITTYSICLCYLLTNFDCKKIQNYILLLESVLSLLIFIGYLVLGLANHFWLADSFICGSLTFLLYVKADISLILNAISSYVK